MTKIDIAVVGGGIAGLMVAYEVTRQFPDLHTFVFEKEKFLGDHTSSRNSGVVHSGLYYTKNSLKHRLCLEGNRLWEKLSRDLEITFRRCGKFIFCSNDLEQATLEQLKVLAEQNSVEGVRWATSAEMAGLKAFVAIKNAIFVPSSGIIDVPAAMSALEREIINHDGNILKSNFISRVSQHQQGFLLETRDGPILSRALVNTAGLWSVSLGQQLWQNGLDDYYVKGNYLRYSGDFYRTSFIYPCPLPHLKGLGIHSTFDIAGQVKFGPNTEDVKAIDYSIDLNSLEQMKSEIVRYYPSVGLNKLSPDYCGIRSKIKLNGQLFQDFWIKGQKETNIPNYVEVCGYESPGLTASPAMARSVVKMLGI
ncbi:MAG: NAD(P)/FAD-dependent oxidoreductase [Bdellovibrio sp.]|nr:NAD(P)/FAD-dependent oxidoreductase [Bdellovibrio sp.]